MKLLYLLSVFTFVTLGFVACSNSSLPSVEVPSDVAVTIMSILHQILFQQQGQRHKDAFVQAFSHLRDREIGKSFSSYNEALEFFEIEFMAAFTLQNPLFNELTLIWRPECSFREIIKRVAFEGISLVKRVIIRLLEDEFVCRKSLESAKMLTNPESPELNLASKNIGDFTLKIITRAVKNTKILSLNLSGNCITNISILDPLQNIRILHLRDNQISEVSSYLKITNLAELYLSGNQIEDISKFSHIIGLNILDLSNNKITDISPLAHLGGLKTLDLSNNKIVDVKKLGLSLLRHLNLSHNQITDISALTYSYRIGDLNVSNNPISNLSVVSSSFPFLCSLCLSEDQITDFPPKDPTRTFTLLKTDGNVQTYYVHPSRRS